MTPNLRIAFRVLTAKKRAKLMSLACTILGVGLFIVTQATTSGFQKFFIKVILGINGAALMKALGLQLDDLIDLAKSRGAVVDGNDILLEPTKILPPPMIEARLESIGVVNDELVQTFVTTPLDSIFERYIRPDSTHPNYVYFRGGRLRFGKLEMIDTDLHIVDADPLDPFDLYLAKYNRQLVAGVSRNLETYGLRVVMPDFADLGASQPLPVAAR